MPRPSEETLFVFGAPRSGTSALTRILCAHPEVHVFHELRVLEIAAMVGHLLSSGAARVPARAGRDAWALGAPVARALLRHLRRRKGVRWIGDKYPPYAAQTNVLEAVFPGCRVVLILRDGRDVAASVRSTSARRRAWRRGAGRPSMCEAPDSWVAFNHQAVRAIGRLGSRALLLRYEDAAAAPEEAANRIEAFLGIRRSPDFHEAMAGFRRTSDWRHSLSPTELAAVRNHRHATQLLEMLRYPPTPDEPDLPPDSPVTCLNRAELALEEGERRGGAEDLCRALDGPWEDPAVPRAARRLVGLHDLPHAPYALFHLAERGDLSRPANREAVKELVRARGLDAAAAEALFGGVS